MEHIVKTVEIRTVEFFCGVGGNTRGLIDAGMTPVRAYDLSEDALAIYRQNIGEHARRADLTRYKDLIPAVKKLRPDLIAGGPPCQDFSAAGNRIEGARAALTVNFARIIAAVLPTWFLMENVPQARKSRSYRKAREILKAAGYGFTEIEIDASLCGVPQARKRFFCIGRLGEQDGFLSDALNGGLHMEAMTVRRFFETRGLKRPPKHYYRHPRFRDRRGVFSIDEPAPTVTGSNRPMPPSYRRHKNDSTGRRSVRSLTWQERSLIQTFPPTWRWSGTPTAINKMIGNAVPPLLATYVGRHIVAYAVSQSLASLAIAA